MTILSDTKLTRSNTRLGQKAEKDVCLHHTMDTVWVKKILIYLYIRCGFSHSHFFSDMYGGDKFSEGVAVHAFVFVQTP